MLQQSGIRSTSYAGFGGIPVMVMGLGFFALKPVAQGRVGGNA